MGWGLSVYMNCVFTDRVVMEFLEVLLRACNWKWFSALQSKAFTTRTLEGEHFPLSFSLDCSHNLITSLSLSLSLSDLIHCWNSIHHWIGADLPVLLPGPQVERHGLLHGRHLDSPHRVAYRWLTGRAVRSFLFISVSSS